MKLPVLSQMECCQNKDKAVPLHATKMLGGRGGVTPTPSRHQTGGEWSASRPGRALAPGK
jgi:hypothetical protein